MRRGISVPVCQWLTRLARRNGSARFQPGTESRSGGRPAGWPIPFVTAAAWRPADRPPAWRCFPYRSVPAVDPWLGRRPEVRVWAWRTCRLRLFGDQRACRLSRAYWSSNRLGPWPAAQFPFCRRFFLSRLWFLPRLTPSFSPRRCLRSWELAARPCRRSVSYWCQVRLLFLRIVGSQRVLLEQSMPRIRLLRKIHRSCLCNRQPGHRRPCREAFRLPASVIRSFVLIFNSVLRVRPRPIGGRISREYSSHADNHHGGQDDESDDISCGRNRLFRGSGLLGSDRAGSDMAISL